MMNEQQATHLESIKILSQAAKMSYEHLIRLGLGKSSASVLTGYIPNE